MKTIGFVVPYFTCGNGTVHPMTQLWLDSCKYNSTVDWLFFTDCDLSSFDVPANVQIIKSSFEEIKAKIQSLFSFKISLNKPYKLCDFKPVYGEAFTEELQNYDFWGFCDIDLIWGDIRKFITDEILEKYDRVLTHGHCSLFRNTQEVNKAYRTLDPKGGVWIIRRSFPQRNYGLLMSGLYIMGVGTQKYKSATTLLCMMHQFLLISKLIDFLYIRHWNGWSMKMFVLEIQYFI